MPKDLPPDEWVDRYQPPPVTESRVTATARWKRERRWDEVSLYRDQRRTYHRAQRRTASAGAYAWADAIAKYPALPEPENQPEPAKQDEQAPDPLGLTASTLDIIETLAAVPTDWERDVHWVYSHLEHPCVRIDQAPSLGAWGLLRYARDDRARFFSQAAAVLRAPETAATPETATPKVDGDPGLAELQRMISGERTHAVPNTAHPPMGPQ